MKCADGLEYKYPPDSQLEFTASTLRQFASAFDSLKCPESADIARRHADALEALKAELFPEVSA